METVADHAMDQLFDVAVVLGDLMSARLSRHGLTPARAEVLWVLSRQGPMTQKDLSRVLKCTPRNVTGLVDALLKAELVERLPHPTDRRAVQVALTERGRALLAEWGTERARGTVQALDGIAPSDLATFSSVLDRVLANLRGIH